MCYLFYNLSPPNLLTFKQTKHTIEHSQTKSDNIDNYINEFKQWKQEKESVDSTVLKSCCIDITNNKYMSTLNQANQWCIHKARQACMHEYFYFT